LRQLTYKNKNYDCLDNETVLETLLRHKIDVSYSCNIGICQSCLLKTSSSEIPERAQLGINKNLVQQKYFLPCVCRPDNDFEVVDSNRDDIFIDTIVLEKNWLSKNTCQFIIEKPDNLEFHAGQFINIKKTNSITRSYSIANASNRDKIELHIKHLQNGQMSNWMCSMLNLGDHIEIQGANGDCFYDADTRNQNILLIGTGTGLAPLLGITREALKNDHRGDIHLYHGSRYCDGLYLVDALRELEKQHSNFHYYPCISSSNPLLNNEKNIPDCIHERADDYALKNHTSLRDWKIYLCGHPKMVNSVKVKSYIAGAALTDIHVDPFELKDLRTHSR